MPDEVDSLILEASVVDDFSRELNELTEKLSRVHVLSEMVDPIDVDARIAGAMADLETVETRLDALDMREANPEVEVDTDMSSLQRRVRMIQARGEQALMGGGGSRLDNMSQWALTSGIVMDAFGDVGESVTPDVPFPGARSFGDISDDFANLELHMSGFMTLLASLMPLMVLFIGTLPGAIAGLVALAGAAVAAAGALVALPALGLAGMAFQDGEFNLGELQRRFDDLVNTFTQAFGPTMEALAPFMERLFQQFNFLIRDLGQRSRVLLGLTEEIGGAFAFLSETIGPALHEMMLFVEDAEDALAFIFGGIASIDWFGIFAGVLRDTLPPLAEFVGHMMTLMPIILDLSVGFMKVANVLWAAINVVFAFIDMVPFLTDQLGVLIGIILVAATATALWSLTMDSAIGTIIRLTGEAIGRAITAIYAYTGSMWAAYGATAAVVGLLTLGLVPLLNHISQQFMGIEDQIDRATSSLDNFAKTSNRLSGTDLGRGVGFNENGPGYRRAGSRTVVAPDKETGNALINQMDYMDRNSTTDPSDVENRQHSK